jgi:membrane protease YdiL (CAAX protease family)
MPIKYSGLKTAWGIIWRIVLFYIVWGILLSAIILPFASRMAAWFHTAPIKARLFGDISTAVTILAATWIMTKFIDRRPLYTIGLAFDHVIKDFLIGAAIGCTWLGVSVVIVWLFGWGILVSPSGYTLPVLVGLAVSMLLNVFAQELLLCGFIFQTIRNKSNLIIAILLSAAIFAGYHTVAFKGEWLPVVNVFAAGILFCFAYVITGNLWFPIAIHFTWDVLLGPVLGLTVSGKSDLGGGWQMFIVTKQNIFTGGTFGLEGGLIVMLTTVTAIIFIYYFHRYKTGKRL